jgi:pre-mRNA-processing factor 39
MTLQELTLPACAQLENTDNFESWEKLVRAAETLEGGLNRNSSPQAIATIRDAYDRFLAKFPLLFGYWKKYADLEFSIAGTEAAEMVRLGYRCQTRCRNSAD